MTGAPMTSTYTLLEPATRRLSLDKIPDNQAIALPDRFAPSSLVKTTNEDTIKLTITTPNKDGKTTETIIYNKATGEFSDSTVKTNLTFNKPIERDGDSVIRKALKSLDITE